MDVGRPAPEATAKIKALCQVEPGLRFGRAADMETAVVERAAHLGRQHAVDLGERIADGVRQRRVGLATDPLRADDQGVPFFLRERQRQQEAGRRI